MRGAVDTWQRRWHQQQGRAHGCRNDAVFFFFRAVPAEAVPAVAASPAAEGSAELSFVFKDYALRHTETSKARSSFGACVGTSASSSSDSVIVNRGGYPGPGVGGVRLDAAVLGRRGSGGEWGQDWSVGKDVPLAGRPLFTSVTSFKVCMGEGQKWV